MDTELIEERPEGNGDTMESALHASKETTSYEVIEDTGKAASHASGKRSNKSGKSREPSISCVTAASSIRSALARKRAEAESARVGLTFARKEAEIIKEQANKTAQLKILQHERKIAEAEAEVKVYEESSESDVISQTPPLLLPYEDPVRRTEHYVTTHAVIHSDGANKQDTTQSAQQANKQSCDQVKTNNTVIQGKNKEKVDKVKECDRKPSSPNCPDKRLNPNAAPYKPPDLPASEFTRFLLRKDLILSRLTNFDDKPENYSLWKECC